MGAVHTAVPTNGTLLLLLLLTMTVAETRTTATQLQKAQAVPTPTLRSFHNGQERGPRQQPTESQAIAVVQSHS